MTIIGQAKLLEQLQTFADSNLLPQFCLITGAVGSGKKLVAEYIAQLLKVDTTIVVQSKAESVHMMIDTARQISGKTAFLLFDADKMSNQSKNAVLKILEEPPKEAYFIMTASDLGMIPTTILSRATLFNLAPYSSLDIVRYAKLKNDNIDDNELKIITSICEVPGEVDKVMNSNTFEFYTFVSTVVENIDKVSGANSFKIAEKLALKDEPDKYDVKLFLKAFMTICLDKCREDMLRYLSAVTVTVDYMSEANITGTNKQMLIGNWILDVRKAMK